MPAVPVSPTGRGAAGRPDDSQVPVQGLRGRCGQGSRWTSLLKLTCALVALLSPHSRQRPDTILDLPPVLAPTGALRTGAGQFGLFRAELQQTLRVHRPSRPGSVQTVGSRLRLRLAPSCERRLSACRLGLRHGLDSLCSVPGGCGPAAGAEPRMSRPPRRLERVLSGPWARVVVFKLPVTHSAQ